MQTEMDVYRNKENYMQATEETRKPNDMKDDNSSNSNNSLVSKKLAYLVTSTGMIQTILKERENALSGDKEMKQMRKMQ